MLMYYTVSKNFTSKRPKTQEFYGSYYWYIQRMSVQSIPDPDVFTILIGVPIFSILYDHKDTDINPHIWRYGDGFRQRVHEKVHAMTCIILIRRSLSN